MQIYFFCHTTKLVFTRLLKEIQWFFVDLQTQQPMAFPRKIHVLATFTWWVSMEFSAHSVFLEQHLSSHGKWTVRDSELALGDPCRHVFPKKSRGSLRHCNAMPASNAYDSMSWKYISMASWMGIFLARKSLGDLLSIYDGNIDQDENLPHSTWYKLCLSLGETQKFWGFEYRNVTKLVFKTGALILSHIYIMYTLCNVYNIH